SLHERLRRQAPGPELLLARHGDKPALIARAGALGHRLVVAESQVVARRQNQVLPVLIVPGEVLEREQRSDTDPFRVAAPARGLELAAQLVDAYTGILIAVRLLQVVTRVVINLIVTRLVVARQSLLSLELDTWAIQIVVIVHVDARLDLTREIPAADVLELR